MEPYIAINKAYLKKISWCLIRYDDYRKTSNISRTFVGIKIVDNSDVVGASPATSSFST